MKLDGKGNKRVNMMWQHILACIEEIDEAENIEQDDIDELRQCVSDLQTMMDRQNLVTLD